MSLLICSFRSLCPLKQRTGLSLASFGRRPEGFVYAMLTHSKTQGSGPDS